VCPTAWKRAVLLAARLGMILTSIASVRLAADCMLSSCTFAVSRLLLLLLFFLWRRLCLLLLVRALGVLP